MQLPLTAEVHVADLHLAIDNLGPLAQFLLNPSWQIRITCRVCHRAAHRISRAFLVVVRSQSDGVAIRIQHGRIKSQSLSAKLISWWIINGLILFVSIADDS